MRITSDVASIPVEKLTHYLLQFRPRNDKSRLLARIGFSTSAPQLLEAALLRHAAEADAVLDEQDVYGDRFVISGKLVGPIGDLSIHSIWIRKGGESTFHFVTLIPVKEKR